MTYPRISSCKSCDEERRCEVDNLCRIPLIERKYVQLSVSDKGGVEIRREAKEHEMEPAE